MLGRREKHLEYSVTSLLERLWVEGEVHFKVDQEESLVNDLVVMEAVVVGVDIGRSQRAERMKMMETSSTWLAPSGFSGTLNTPPFDSLWVSSYK